ncbi:MAG: hypothetical protein PSV35_07325, partial [bacterium]|nr:hypothetical protein [bacterium]
GYYHGGGYGWGGGGYSGGWGGPNIILNVPIVPVQPYPVPVVECETVKVCDNYEHRCWYERYCD